MLRYFRYFQSDLAFIHQQLGGALASVDHPLSGNSVMVQLGQGWGTYGPRANCGPREHLVWAASEFSLPKLEHNITIKMNFHVKQTRRQTFKRSLSLLDAVFSPCFPWEDKGKILGRN